MKNRSIKMLVLIFCVFLLAGCHKLEATTKIDPNGSGELRMGVGFSAEERANMEKQSSNPQDFCNTSQTPANIKVTEEPRGEETWCFTTAQFKTLGELRSLYEQRKGIRVNRLEFKDGRFLYEVELDTLSEDSGLSQLTEITWSVVMPGALIDHNADQVDGNTLTWRPAPKSGIILLRAESELPQSGFDFPACGGAFVISIGGVFLHITHGRARRTKDTSE